MKNVLYRRRRFRWLATIAAITLLSEMPVRPETGDSSTIPWKQCLQQDDGWYNSPEAMRIADNVLLYQLDSGAWPKNIDMAIPLSDREKQEHQTQKSRREESTIDNGATVTQLQFLAKVFNAMPRESIKTALMNGLNYLLNTQYENGGWPQFPYRKGYYSHITFNDNAMINVMNLLRDIYRSNDYAFIDSEQKKRIEKSIQKGIDCIVQCQIIVDGKRTAWCAQHDEITLQPASARIYEKASLSGSESLGIVRFLMGIENPSPDIIDAVHSAVRWFNDVKINGIRQIEKPDPSLPKGRDKIVVADSTAPPLWARFYEIGSNRPLFCGRDGIVKYSLAEIEHERRIGYSWYTDSPAKLLDKEYPVWQKKWAPHRNILLEAN